MGFNRGIGKAGEKPGLYSQLGQESATVGTKQGVSQGEDQRKGKSSRGKRNRKNQHTVFQWVFQEFGSNHAAEQPLRGSFSSSQSLPITALEPGAYIPSGNCPLTNRYKGPA